MISRTNIYNTPEERLKDVAFIDKDKITTEEINGNPWVIGTDSDTSKTSVLIYAAAFGGYIYTFSFSSDILDVSDYAEFTKVFIGAVNADIEP